MTERLKLRKKERNLNGTERGTKYRIYYSKES